MLASDNLLNALDARFQNKTNQEGDEEPATSPNPAGPVPAPLPKPEPPSPVPEFDKASDEAGRALRSWWLIRQDVKLLDYDYTPVDGRTPLPIESLFTQLQERRLQSKINGAKKIFNESARGNKASDDSKSFSKPIQDARNEAEKRLQEVGFESYLSLAMLGASHKDGPSFSNSGAGELRTKLGVASRVHTMIRGGKQPDGYIESFIPNRNPAELYADAVTATLSAISKENAARASKQAQLLSLGRIANEIGSQRQSFRYPLEQLSGFRFEANEVKYRGKTMMITLKEGEDPVKLDPLNLEHRAQFFAEVDLRIGTVLKAHFNEISRRTRSTTESIHNEQGEPDVNRIAAAGTTNEGQDDLTLAGSLTLDSFGALGGNAIEIQKALTAINQTHEAMKDDLERILDEKLYAAQLDGIDQQALNATKDTLRDWAMKQQVLAAAGVMFSATSANVSSGSSGFSVGVSTNPTADLLADAEVLKVENQLNRELLLEDARLDAEAQKRAAGLQLRIREIFRSFRIKAGSMKQTLLDLEAARNAYAMNRSLLESLVEDWAAAKHLAAEQFEGYAAQCVQRESSRIEADQSLADAVTACYLASKAMQYVWVERYSNPVTVTGTGTDVVLPKKEFRPFTNPESVLGARNANELRDYLEALYVWHNTLASGLRGSPRGNEVRFTKMISLRRDMLGMDEHVVRPEDSLIKTKRLGLQDSAVNASQSFESGLINVCTRHVVSCLRLRSSSQLRSTRTSSSHAMNGIRKYFALG